MQFQTPIHICPLSRRAAVEDAWLFLGSCFSDAVSSKMREYYLRVASNPFGTLYNPLSIAQAIRMREVPPLVEWGGLWHAMSHHGDFSHSSESQTRDAVSRSIKTMQQAICEARFVVVTFGTAWVYEDAETKQIVANCHKMPADRFTRRRLTIEEIVDTWAPLIDAFPDKQWVFTVSPIRHTKDGLHENQLSKATLLMAVEELCRRYSPEQVAYFPSYEIMQDELRDYRFYADDMVHPSPLAVHYIWERFEEACFTPSARAELDELHQLWADRHHTLMHPDTPEAHAFILRTQEACTRLQKRFPMLPLAEDAGAIGFE